MSPVGSAHALGGHLQLTIADRPEAQANEGTGYEPKSSLSFSKTQPACLLCAQRACSSSTTGPEGGEQIFTGQVAYQNPDLTFHTFIITDTSIVRVEILELAASAGDLEIPEGYTVTLGFGLGFPVEGECRPTYQSTVIEGSQFSFQLTPNEYCILLVDPGTLLEPMVVDYVVSLQGD